MDSLDILVKIEFDKYLIETPMSDWVSFEQFKAAWIIALSSLALIYERGLKGRN